MVLGILVISNHQRHTILKFQQIHGKVHLLSRYVKICKHWNASRSLYRGHPIHLYYDTGFHRRNTILFCMVQIKM